MRQKSTPAARNAAILCKLGMVLLITVLSEKPNPCPRAFLSLGFGELLDHFRFLGTNCPPVDRV